MDTLNFSIGRVEKALADAGRYKKIDEVTTEKVKLSTRRLIKLCGDFSQNRKMALRIGLALMNNCNTILVPVCLNYGNLENYQTEAKLFIEKQLAFLNIVSEVVSGLAIKFLLPDHEASNNELCRVSGKSAEGIEKILAEVQLIVSSLVTTNEQSCILMSSLIPEISMQEKEVYEAINANKDYEQKISAHAWQRRAMYLNGSCQVSFEDMRIRTAQTASQYIVLGRFAAENNYLVCNHTTTSLRWYMETNVAVLHNPISLI